MTKENRLKLFKEDPKRFAVYGKEFENIKEHVTPKEIKVESKVNKEQGNK